VSLRLVKTVPLTKPGRVERQKSSPRTIYTLVKINSFIEKADPLGKILSLNSQVHDPPYVKIKMNGSF
jgi:hypothetical protein